MGFLGVLQSPLTSQKPACSWTVYSILPLEISCSPESLAKKILLLFIKKEKKVSLIFCIACHYHVVVGWEERENCCPHAGPINLIYSDRELGG